MQKITALLIATLRLVAALPHADSLASTACVSASFGNFSWILQDFTYSSSDVFTTPSHEVASGSVEFNLTNPAIPETVHCNASSTVPTAFFDGNVVYTCKAPARSATKTKFTFDAGNNELNINQTWTCSSGNPHSPGVTFIGLSAVNLSPNCTTFFYQNPMYPESGSGLYSAGITMCAPLTLPLTPQYKAAVA
ncbi:hypothetical protein F4808DRAFT_474879 [Astrocystis sublimbata]|nr:hypothetical protein F4808DRAFT_474879 [Astrocystis sublimbata]